MQLAIVDADLAARHASTVAAGWGGVSSHCEMSVSLRWGSAVSKSLCACGLYPVAK